MLDIAVEGSQAVLAIPNGIQVVDVTRPESPVLYDSSGFAAYPRAVALAGDLVYVSSWPSFLRIIDVSDPSDPIMLSAIDLQSEPAAVAVSGNRA